MAANESVERSFEEEWRGKAVLKFEVTAEPKRAMEIALERAESYIALLQFYSAPAIHFRMSSHVAPLELRPYPSQRILLWGTNRLTTEESLAQMPWQMELTKEFLVELSRAGFWTLAALAEHRACEFEEELTSALMVFGRSCYHVDATDKLLQVVSAIEMFALRDPDEPISASVADRIAFAISHDPDNRKEIAKNFRGIYNLRSRRVHHGRSIEEDEEIDRFLRNAWAFFFEALRHVGRFRTKMEFLDELDNRKYGNDGRNRRSENPRDAS